MGCSGTLSMITSFFDNNSKNKIGSICIFVTPTFYKNNIFVHIGVYIKMHIKL
jgi:hypothetical protein